MCVNSYFSTPLWMMQKQLCLLAALSLALGISCADSQGASTAAAAAAPLGAYLGCFDLQRVKNLPGLRETGEAPHTASTLYRCPAACREGNFSITFISTALRCWCALATPQANATMPISACKAGGPGLAGFYQHDLAATHWCKIVPTPLTPEDISVDYNQHNVEFTPTAAAAANTTDLPAQMRIRMEGSSGARVRPKAPAQLYGQFEVTAKVAEAVGAVTAFYVRDSDEYNQDNSGDFEEIDVEFLNGHPGIPNSVWFNSYHRGLSRGEQLTTPEVYQRLLNLSSSANNTNTWLTYTFSWQPSHVLWAINGVPLLRRTTGELVRWSDMKGKPFERIFVSPDRPMHVSFSMWTDNSRHHFGGEIDSSQSPFYSYFRELRRIACVDPLPANATEPYGPTWLYEGKASWPAAPVPAYTAPPLPSPSPSPSPSSAPTQSSSPSPPSSSSCVASITSSPAVSCGSGPASTSTNTSHLSASVSSPEHVAAQAQASPAPSATAPEPTPVSTAVRGSSSSPVVSPPPDTGAALSPVAVPEAPPVPSTAPAAPAAGAALAARAAPPAAGATPTDRQPMPPATQAASGAAPAGSSVNVPLISAPPQRSTAAETVTAHVKAPSLVPPPAMAAPAALAAVAVPAAPAAPAAVASPPQLPQEAHQDNRQPPQQVASTAVSPSPLAVLAPPTPSPPKPVAPVPPPATTPAAPAAATQAGKVDSVTKAHQAVIAATIQQPQPLQAKPQLLRAAAVEAARVGPHAAAAAAASSRKKAGQRSRRWLQEVQDSWQGAAAGDAPLAEALGAVW